MERVKLIEPAQQQLVKAELSPHAYTEQLKLAIPTPRVKLIDHDAPQQRRAEDTNPVVAIGKAWSDHGQAIARTFAIDVNVAFKGEFTPWYHTTRVGPPVRTGVYQTSAEGLRPAQLRPWRKYFGPNSWSKACTTPHEAAQQETSLHAGTPTFWRGLVREHA